MFGLFGLLINSFLFGIGSALSGGLAMIAAIAFAVIALTGFVAFAAIAFAAIAFAERCTTCVCLGAATSLMRGVVSGTFLALAATTAIRHTKQRAIRSPALGGFRFHRVPCPSDG